MKAKLPAKIAGIVVLGVIAYFVAKPFIGTSIKEKTSKTDSTQVVKDSIKVQPTQNIGTPATPANPVKPTVKSKSSSKSAVTKTATEKPVVKSTKVSEKPVKSAEKKKDSRDNLDIANF